MDPLSCPACHEPLTVEHYAGHYGRQVELDVCHHCNALWFDKLESIGLSPAGVLSLMRSMMERHEDPRRPLPDRMDCVRCRMALRASTRRTATLRYQLHDCPRDHGHFITFFELLREKDFIRPLTGAPLRELRAQVRMVRCSSCAAPIDLERSAACDHCSAPLAVLDPDAMANALERLNELEQARASPDPDLVASQLVLDRLRTETAFKRLERDPRGWKSVVGGGLVEACVEVVLGVLFS